MRKYIIAALFLSLNISEAAIEKVTAEKAFDSNLPMEQRWDSFHDHIKKNPKDSLRMAKKAVRSQDWFLREAGLKTYMVIDGKQAKQIARELLEKDSSLLVRTSALKALKILKDKESKPLLLKSLNDPRNFRKKQSLWIRPQIVSALLELKLLNSSDLENLKSDKDPQIAKMAKAALL